MRTSTFGAVLVVRHQPSSVHNNIGKLENASNEIGLHVVIAKLRQSIFNLNNSHLGMNVGVIITNNR